MKLIFYHKMKTFIVIALVISIGFSSCLKDDDDTFIPTSYLNVVNSSPKTTDLQFALDQNRVNINGLSYKYYTNYINAFPGERVFKVYRKNENTPILTKNISLMERKYYSIFIADTLSKMEAILLRDSTRDVGNDSVRIRFANFSPDVAAVDFYIQGNNTPVATNVAYKSAKDFISIKTANDVKFEVKQNGQTTVLATSETMNLVNKNIYTIWSTGFKSQTDDGKISIVKMRH